MFQNLPPVEMMDCVALVKFDFEPTLAASHIGPESFLQIETSSAPHRNLLIVSNISNLAPELKIFFPRNEPTGKLLGFLDFG